MGTAWSENNWKESEEVYCWYLVAFVYLQKNIEKIGWKRDKIQAFVGIKLWEALN